MTATFTTDQQHFHRDAFIKECRQKAWGARCHADWVAKGLDTIMAEYEKLKAEDERFADEIKALETAVDSHSKDNREKRKALQERRNAVVPVQNPLAENMRQGQKGLQGLYQSAEASLQLAEHAEKWEWKETAPTDNENKAPAE